MWDQVTGQLPFGAKKNRLGACSARDKAGEEKRAKTAEETLADKSETRFCGSHHEAGS